MSSRDQSLAASGQVVVGPIVNPKMHQVAISSATFSSPVTYWLTMDGYGRLIGEVAMQQTPAALPG